MSGYPAANTHINISNISKGTQSDTDGLWYCDCEHIAPTCQGGYVLPQQLIKVYHSLDEDLYLSFRYSSE